MLGPRPLRPVGGTGAGAEPSKKSRIPIPTRLCARQAHPFDAVKATASDAPLGSISPVDTITERSSTHLDVESHQQKRGEWLLMIEGQQRSEVEPWQWMPEDILLRQGDFFSAAIRGPLASTTTTIAPLPSHLFPPPLLKTILHFWLQSSRDDVHDDPSMVFHRLPPAKLSQLLRAADYLQSSPLITAIRDAWSHTRSAISTIQPSGAKCGSPTLCRHLMQAINELAVVRHAITQQRDDASPVQMLLCDFWQDAIENCTARASMQHHIVFGHIADLSADGAPLLLSLCLSLRPTDLATLFLDLSASRVAYAVDTLMPLARQQTTRVFVKDVCDAMETLLQANPTFLSTAVHAAWDGRAAAALDALQYDAISRVFDAPLTNANAAYHNEALRHMMTTWAANETSFTHRAVWEHFRALLRRAESYCATLKALNALKEMKIT